MKVESWAAPGPMGIVLTMDWDTSNALMACLLYGPDSMPKDERRLLVEALSDARVKVADIALVSKV